MIVLLVDMPIKRDSAIAARVGLEHILTEEGLQLRLSVETVPLEDMLPLPAIHAFHVLQERPALEEACHHTESVV